MTPCQPPHAVAGPSRCAVVLCLARTLEGPSPMTCKASMVTWSSLFRLCQVRCPRHSSCMCAFDHASQLATSGNMLSRGPFAFHSPPLSFTMFALCLFGSTPFLGPLFLVFIIFMPHSVFGPWSHYGKARANYGKTAF